ncbi:MAG: hypothetical protein ABGX87_12675 [Alcanivorax sp.]
MAYETGVAADVTALLGTIRVFAESLGWTIARDNTNELALHHADAGWFTLVATPQTDDIYTSPNPRPYIDVWGQTGFDDGAAYNQHPGSSGDKWGRANGLRGPFTAYHLFGTTQYIHCAIEVVPGEFAHLQFGKLVKAGVYDGGEYAAGTAWYYALQGSNYNGQYDSNRHSVPWDGMSYYAAGQAGAGAHGAVRLDADGYSNEWGRFTYDLSTGYSSIFGPARLTDNQERSPWWSFLFSTPNTVNAVSPLAPIVPAFILRNSKTFLPGAPADLRLVNMRNLVPGEMITIGSDEWLCFPIKKRSLVQRDTSNVVNSWIAGYAYRKVP